MIVVKVGCIIIVSFISEYPLDKSGYTDRPIITDWGLLREAHSELSRAPWQKLVQKEEFWKKGSER